MQYNREQLMQSILEDRTAEVERDCKAGWLAVSEMLMDSGINIYEPNEESIH